MKLTLHERYALGGFLPAEGGWVMVRQLRELREALGPSEAERKKFNIRELLDAEGFPTGRVAWNPHVNDDGKEFAIADPIVVAIVASLKKHEGAEKLNVAHATLYEKFVDPGPEKPADDGKKPPG